MSRNYLDASNFAADEIEEVIDIKSPGKLDFPECTFADIVVSWAGGIAKHTAPILGTTYFEMSQSLGAALSNIAMKDYQFFDKCMQMCSANILCLQPLPRGLETLAAGVLTGKISRPSPRHRERQRKFLEQMFIYRLTEDVAQEFGLPITRNDATQAKSAADVVAEALTVCGVKTKYTAIKNLFLHQQFEQFRKELTAANKIYNQYGEAAGSIALTTNNLLRFYEQDGVDQFDEQKKLENELIEEIVSTLALGKKSVT